MFLSSLLHYFSSDHVRQASNTFLRWTQNSVKLSKCRGFFDVLNSNNCACFNSYIFSLFKKLLIKKMKNLIFTHGLYLPRSHLPTFQFPFSDPLEYSLLLTSWIVFQFIYANMRKLKCIFILFFWIYTKYTMVHMLLCTFLFSFNNISWQAVYREVSRSFQSCILFDYMDGL